MSPKRSQWGAKWSQTAPKVLQNGAKMAPKAPPNGAQKVKRTSKFNFSEKTLKPCYLLGFRASRGIRHPPIRRNFLPLPPSNSLPIYILLYKKRFRAHHKTSSALSALPVIRLPRFTRDLEPTPPQTPPHLQYSISGAPPRS